MSNNSEYDAVVPADKMPPCPICGKPIYLLGPDSDRLLVFYAHGMAALGHDRCKVEVINEKQPAGGT